jgi:hypothetical protein
MEGTIETALQYYRHALAIRTKTCGPMSKETADTHFNVALLHRRLSEHQTSAHHFRQAAVAFAALFGPDHPDTLEASKQADAAERRTQRGTRRLSTTAAANAAETVVELEDTSV